MPKTISIGPNPKPTIAPKAQLARDHAHASRNTLPPRLVRRSPSSRPIANPVAVATGAGAKSAMPAGARPGGVCLLISSPSGPSRRGADRSASTKPGATTPAARRLQLRDVCLHDEMRAARQRAQHVPPCPFVRPQPDAHPRSLVAERLSDAAADPARADGDEDMLPEKSIIVSIPILQSVCTRTFKPTRRWPTRTPILTDFDGSLSTDGWKPRAADDAPE